MGAESSTSSSDAAALADSEATISVSPLAILTAETLVEQFGSEDASLDALFLSMNSGYSTPQIHQALLDSSLQANGSITGVDPSQKPLNFILLLGDEGEGEGASGSEAGPRSLAFVQDLTEREEAEWWRLLHLRNAARQQAQRATSREDFNIRRDQEGLTLLLALIMDHHLSSDDILTILLLGSQPYLSDPNRVGPWVDPDDNTEAAAPTEQPPTSVPAPTEQPPTSVPAPTEVPPTTEELIEADVLELSMLQEFDIIGFFNEVQDEWRTASAYGDRCPPTSEDGSITISVDRGTLICSYIRADNYRLGHFSIVEASGNDLGASIGYEVTPFRYKNFTEGLDEWAEMRNGTDLVSLLVEEMDMGDTILRLAKSLNGFYEYVTRTANGTKFTASYNSEGVLKSLCFYDDDSVCNALPVD